MRRAKVDKRKLRRLKRRTAKKIKYMILDEGGLAFSYSDGMREFKKRIDFLTNQHLLKTNKISQPAIDVEALLSTTAGQAFARKVLTSKRIRPDLQILEDELKNQEGFHTIKLPEDPDEAKKLIEEIMKNYPLPRE